MGMKPGPAKGFPSKGTLTRIAVGCCTECRTYIYPDQKHVRVRRPTIGWNHSECVPKGAVVVEVVQP
jgi:hypothetical protein